MDCAELRELAPDVALGLLTGEARAAALGHLQGCEGCRAEVASLAAAADEMLLAAPEATPPDWFANRVLTAVAAEASRSARSPATPGSPAAHDPGHRPDQARLPGATSRPGRPRRWRSGRRRRPVVIAGALAAVAAMLAVVAAVGAVSLGGDPAPDGDVVLAAEMRTGRGRVVGEVTLTGDGPVEVAVDVPEWAELVERWEDEASGDYWLAIETRDGERTMHPAPGGDGGDDGWSVAVDAAAGDVAGVAVVDGEGRIWCSSTFPA